MLMLISKHEGLLGEMSPCSYQLPFHVRGIPPGLAVCSFVLILPPQQTSPVSRQPLGTFIKKHWLIWQIDKKHKISPPCSVAISKATWSCDCYKGWCPYVDHTTFGVFIIEKQLLCTSWISGTVLGCCTDNSDSHGLAPTLIKAGQYR